jgi:biopolymer transport protein ExbB
MYEMILAAGWPAWPLLLTSILALAILLERFWFLQQKKVSPPHLIKAASQVYDSGLLNQSQSAAALQSLSDAALLGRILASGLQAYQKKPSADFVTTAMQETAQDVAYYLERYMGALATIATIAPLMGLFGTVVGMIEIFGSQQSGVANPQQLAHGISIALYNTAFGLLIAIPAYAGWRILRSMIDARQRECEQAAKALLEELFPASL